MLPAGSPNSQLGAARAVYGTGRTTILATDETRDTRVTSTVPAIDPEILAERHARFDELAGSPHFEEIVAANGASPTARGSK
jgi:hypothetical protein